jgi:pimeloyl-ACP methyl ester carboxylesterase
MPKQNGIFYTDTGSGFPVILIHGFCETHEIWNEIATELSTGYRVLCIDLPGFGSSELPSTPISILNIAERINGLLDSLAISQATVIGHSLGGYVTLAMVENNQSLFNGFGLFHSTAYPDSEEKKLSRNKVIEFVSTHGVEPFIQSFIPPLFFAQSNPHIKDAITLGLKTKLDTLIAYTEAMRDRLDRTFVLKEFKSPILFLAGDKDTVVNVDAVRDQAQLAALPMVYILTSVAHMGMFEDKSTSIASLNVFLDSLQVV